MTHRHPVTGLLIEDGRGSLPERQQLINHCNAIEQSDGQEAADTMRRELDLPIPSEVAAQAAAAEQARVEREEKAAAALDHVEKLHAQVSALEGRVGAIEKAAAPAPKLQS